MIAQGLPAGAPGRQRYGGFSLDGLQLALPLQALREVQPCSALQALPCAAACVPGGIDLRGVLVPVVDLRVLLNRPAAPEGPAVVLIMVHKGRILGLLADGITGVFDVVADAAHRVTRQATDPGLRRAGNATSDPMPLMSATVRRDDTGELLSVLSPQALATLPRVPMVDDPEPDRQQTDRHDGVSTSGATDRSLMLMRVGRLPLAIDALAVHATLAAPDIKPSALAMGHCRGVIEYGGRDIALLDTLSLCGFGRLVDARDRQAFVLQCEQGQVALLIDSVVDIVRIAADAVQPVPAYALPRPDLVSGGLPLAALPADCVEVADIGIGQFLVLDSMALKTCADLAGAAATNVERGTTAGGVRGKVPANVGVTADTAILTDDKAATDAAGSEGLAGHSLITFDLGSEVATPIDQVYEILPYQQDLAAFDHGGPVLGILANRGRSIPVVCLSRLLTGVAAAASAVSSVLVVDADGDLMGFAVPALKAIEVADGELQVRAMAGRQPGDERLQWPPRHLARVGSGSAERLMPLVQLQQVARAVKQRAA